MSVLDRDWTRPAPTRGRVLVDVVLAVSVAVVCLLSVAVYRSAFGAADGSRGLEAYLWFGIAGLLLAGRRAFPLSTVLAESAVFIVIGERTQDLAGVFTIQMILFAALYAAWAWSRHTRRLWAVSVVVVVAMFGWLAWSFTRPGTLPGTASMGLFPRDVSIVVYSFAINVVYFLGAMTWGQAAWRSARRSAVIEEQLERERARQDADRSNAVRAERVRIARDLHDVVAHHVSSIGIQSAGARRVLERDPEQAAEALGTIEHSSRQAVSQMHQLVGLLRDDGTDSTDGGRGPQPGLADIALLADPDGSPRVDVHVVGAPTSVAPTVGLNLFRVVQESLTNARRHAAARVVQVWLRHLENGAVEVEVIDDGLGAKAGPEDSGGFGLSGIRERAAMLGGEVEIGDRPQGGFRVRVRVGPEGGDA